MCLGIAVLQLPREAATFVRNQQEGLAPFVDVVVELSSGETPDILPDVPPSIEGKYLAMDSCEESLAVNMAAAMLTDAYNATAQACLDQADAILSQSPSFAIAHLVRATALDALDGDRADVRAAVLASAATAPGSAWMALDRLRIMIPEFEAADPDLRGVMAQDVMMAALAADGAPVLAELYVRHPEIRTFVTEVVETLEPRVQRRFITAVRGAAS